MAPPGASAVARAQRLQLGQAVVGEPQRREGEHHRVQPHRHDDQQRRQHQEGGAHRPHQCGRRPEVAGHHADAEQRQPLGLHDRAPLLAGGVLGQRVESHHAVAEPAPDQRRQQQHQRRDQPQRHRHNERRQRRQRGTEGPQQRAPQRLAAAPLEGRKAPPRDQLDQPRHHHQGHDQQRRHHQQRHRQRQHDQRRDHRVQAAAADGVEPVERCGGQRRRLEQVAHRVERGLPEEPAESGGHGTGEEQRQQRQPDDSRMQAVGAGAPEGIEQTSHAQRIPKQRRGHGRGPLTRAAAEPPGSPPQRPEAEGTAIRALPPAHARPALRPVGASGSTPSPAPRTCA